MRNEFQEPELIPLYCSNIHRSIRSGVGLNQFTWDEVKPHCVKLVPLLNQSTAVAPLPITAQGNLSDTRS